MSNPSNEPPKYRKHKPSVQAVVTLSGRDFYLGPHGTKTSLHEYDRVVGEWLARGRTLATVDAGLSVVEIAAAYTQFAKSYYHKNGRVTRNMGRSTCHRVG